MNLIIDIGNSRVKLAVFDRNEMKHSRTAVDFELTDCEKILDEYPVNSAIISSVRGTDKQLNRFLQKRLGHVVTLDYKTPLPFENSYRSKETLGNDRLAAAAAAAELFPNRHILVVDLGSAITIDLVTFNGGFIGGNISPGLQMRFRALHQFTASLPLVEPEVTGKPGETNNEHGTGILHDDEEQLPDALLGKTTREAIRNGVVSGIAFEIQAYIKTLSMRYHDLKVVVTGGDARFFAGKLKNDIFVDPNLILKGLNRILAYHDTPG